MKKFKEFIKESIGDISLEEIENKKKYGSYKKPMNEDRDDDSSENQTSLNDRVTSDLRYILSDLDLTDEPYTYCQECGSGDKSIDMKSIEEAIVKIKKLFNWE